VLGHRPADDPAAVCVLHSSEVEPALPGPQVGDVGDPQNVRGVSLNFRSTRSSATQTPGTLIVVRPRLTLTSPEIRPDASAGAHAGERPGCSVPGEARPGHGESHRRLGSARGSR
jgi:hypothetical protein